jgi:hypothetical protein
LWFVYRAGPNPRPMADPPAGPPEATPTNIQETNFSVEDFQPRVTNIPTRVTRKRGRHNESYAPEESSGRVTTREVWKLIDELKTSSTTIPRSSNRPKPRYRRLNADRMLSRNRTRSCMKKSKLCGPNWTVCRRPPRLGKGPP